MKRIDYRHYIFIAITLGFLALAVFVFPTGINRIIEGGRDFGLSIAYYFMEIFELEHSIVPMVNTLPEVYSEPFLKIAESFEQFQVDWVLYWQRWATVENLQAYMVCFGDFLSETVETNQPYEHPNPHRDKNDCRRKIYQKLVHLPVNRYKIKTNDKIIIKREELQGDCN